MDITIQDLLQAYKKVKVDLFYSNCENYALLLEYEHELEKNLLNLKNKIDQYAKNPKPLDYINSDFSYSLIGKEYDSVKGITLRVMSNFPIEFHVLSSLWIQKIGLKIDATFEDSMIWGNRLRRCAAGELNMMALGNFKPYSGQYQHWQDNAIKAIQSSLEAGIDVSVFSTDAKAFYHSISPKVLKDKNLDKHTEGFENLHAMFSDAIITWSENPKAEFLQERGGEHLGIPVGLSASCVIANWVLSDLDQEIAETIRPLSYGRYVDDILLVVPTRRGKGKQTSDSLSHWLSNLIESLNYVTEKEKKTLQYTWRPATESVDIPNFTISFNNGKEQYQEFSGERGKAELGIFIRQIQERTSEWRALPELPASKSKVIGRLLEVTDAKMVPIQALGSYNKISVVKSRFAFLLRDLESCLRIFSPDAWKDQRIAFLEAFATYLITPEEFFTYEKYLYRVLALGVVCLDYASIGKILYRFEELIEHFKDSRPCNLAGFPHHVYKLETASLDCLTLDLYGKTIRGNVRDLLYRGNPAFDISTFIDTLSAESPITSQFYLDIKDIRTIWSQYYDYDLAVFPYKCTSLPRFINPMILHEIETKKVYIDDLKTKLLDVYRAPLPFDKIKENSVWQYVFPTRPFTANDLSLLLTDPKIDKNWDGMEIFEVLELLRGFHREQNLASLKFSDNNLTIPVMYNESSIPIALACWKMKETEIDDHLKDLTSGSFLVRRYQRFVSLVNQVMNSPTAIRYFVFPELALPPRWFVTASQKLQKRNICLISGIQYIFDEKNSKEVSNEIWASLDFNIFQFPTHFVYRQQKQYPAFDEVALLSAANNLAFIPKQPTIPWPPIIQHGHFFFSLLVCSELLNVKLRSHLVGEIDALIASEWNRDITTFNALVEASAMDLHAYIIQCNNNLYGDCRIRAPHKQDHERDIVKSKGGENDYFIIGKIDIGGLRSFQCNHVPVKNEIFKPFPVGYKMSKNRKEDWKNQRKAE